MRNCITSVFVLLIILSYSLIASGQTISGSVLDGGGLPTPGGFVRIFDSSGEDLGEVGLDENGDFETGELDDGDYFAITIHTHNTIDDIWDGVDGSPCVNKLCTVVDDGTEISIISSANVTGIDFVLDPITSGGIISGHVEDGTGTPLAGVAINMHNRDGHFLWRQTTDESGNYVSELLADETYYVHTENEPLGFGREVYNNHLCLPAYDCDEATYLTSNGSPIVITGSDPAPVNFVLEVPLSGHVLSGKIKDNDLVVPLPDIRVHLLDSAGGDLANTWTDQYGDYYFSGLEVGGYKVYTSSVPPGYAAEVYLNSPCENWSCDLSTTGSVIPMGGDHSPDNNIDLSYTGTRIFGTVTRSDNGDPVSSEFGWFSVDLYESNGDHAHRVHTNSAGQYQFDLYAEDDYYLVTNHDESYHKLFDEGWDDAKCFDDCNPPFAGATLTPVEFDVTKVRDFVLDPAYSISGVIRDEGDNPTSDGYVHIWDHTGTQIATAHNHGDGSYAVQMVAGTYYATARGENWGRISQLWQDIPCPQEYCDITGIGTPIVFPRDEGLSIDFNLMPQDPAWTISGSIRNGAGDPRSGTIRLLEPNGEVVDQFGTEEDGSFQTWPLADGTYFAVTLATDGMLDEAWQDIPCVNQMCDATTATPIVIDGDDATGIDFVLDPITGGGYISGNLTGPGGPLVNTGVTILDRNGEHLMDLRTDPDGNYITPLLANDNYYVHTLWEPLGLGAELYDDQACIPNHVCRDSTFVLANGTVVPIFNADQPDIDFILEVPLGLGMISGRVTDADDGFPLTDLQVELFAGNGNHMNTVTTDLFGDYYFSGLDIGTYKVAAFEVPQGYSRELFNNIPCHELSCDPESQGTVIAITGANTVADNNFALDFVGTRIIGTVTRSDGGDPVSSHFGDMHVGLFDDGGGHLGDSYTNSAGQYQFNQYEHGLSAGDYYLVTNSDRQFHGLIDEGWDNQQYYASYDPFEVGAYIIPILDGETLVRDFALETGATISGTVTAEDGGALLADIEVCVDVRHGPSVGCAQTDDIGEYTVKGLSPETDLVVYVNDTSGQTYLLETWNNKPYGDWDGADGVDVSSSDVTDIDFALAPGYFITGMVRDAVTTAPIDETDVCIYRTNGSWAGICDRTDASGFYQAGTLPAGTNYAAEVRPEHLGYKHQMWEDLDCPNNDCDFSLATPITLGPGDAENIDFFVTPDTAITGTIRSSVTGEPLRNNTGLARLYTTDGSLTYLGRAFTDEIGMYRFSGIDPGSYFVELAPRDLNLVSELYNNIQCPRLTCNTDLGEIITVAEGQIRSGVDATLDSASLITGQINLNGDPLANVHISIYNEAGLFVTRGWSDESGYYQSRAGLPAGNYYAANRRYWEGFDPGNKDYVPMAYPNTACGYPCDVTLGDLIPVNGESDVPDIDFTFIEEQEATISGSILNHSGQPIGGAVQIFDSSDNWQQDFWVDGDGNFETHPLPAGIYFVVTMGQEGFINDRWDDIDGEQCLNRLCDIFSGTPIVITGGVNVTGIDFVLDPITSGGIISGHVEDGIGTPLADMSVRILNQDGAVLAEQQTDSNGDYESRLLADETYYAYTNYEPRGLARELWNNHPCVPAYTCDDQSFITTIGDPIVITGTDPAPVDFVLDLPATGQMISGKITDDDLLVPLANITMVLLSVIGEDLVFTQTDQSGDYYFSGLPDGDYKVLTRNVPNGYVEEMYPNAPCPNTDCDTPTTGDVITLSGTDSADKDIAIAFTGTRFFGTVTRSVGGAPVSSHLGDMHVGLFNAGGDHLGDSYTNNAGQYQIDQHEFGLSTGDYYLVTNSDRQFHGLIDEGWDDVAYFYSFDPIDIGAHIIHIEDGETLLKNFELDPAPTISGTVTADIGGAALADIQVCVIHRDGDELGCARSDELGNYTVKGLLPEPDLVVHVSDTNGQPYLPETWDDKPYGDGYGADGVDISTENATGIDFALAPGYFITGTVRVAATTDPVEGTDICIHRTDGSFTDICAHTNASGFYQAGVLPPGTDYTAYVIPDNQNLGYKRQMWLGLDCPNNQCDFSLATSITLGPGDAENINFNLNPDTGIRGVIRSSVTGEVLSNNEGRARLYSSDGNAGTLAQVFTDENGGDTGSYYFGGLEPGDYLVLAGPGWPIGSNLIDELWNGPGVPGVHCPRLSCDTSGLSGAIITVTEGNIETGIDVELDPGSQITGNLTIDGAPAGAGDVISFYTSDGYYAGYTSTEDDGSFESAAGFPAGDYFAANRYIIDGQEVGGGRNLGFFPTTYLASDPDGTDCGSPCVIETSGGTLIGLNGDDDVGLNTYNWVTQPPASISGSVLDNNGFPVGGALQLFDHMGQNHGDFWMDQDGNFETHPLPAGLYFLKTAYTRDTIGAVWDGDDGSPCPNQLCDVYSGTPIAIYAGINVTGIDFKLDPITSGGTISGHLQDIDGFPLVNMAVVILNRNGDYLSQTNTDLNGDYESGLLADDAYYIHTQNEPLGLGRELYNDHLCLPAYQCDDAAFVKANGDQIDITGNDIPGINFVLEVPVPGHTLSGQVTDNGPGPVTGAPLADIQIHLMSTIGHQLANTQTDRYGNYYFSGLPDGNYKVYTSWVPEGYVGELYPDAPCPDWSCDFSTSGDVIPMSGTHSPGNDIALTYTGTRLFGTVTRIDNGDPVSSHFGWMSVQLYDATGNHINSIGTNSAGQYEFHVDTGVYYLATESDSQFHGLLNEAWNNIPCLDNCNPFDIGADFISVGDGQTLVMDFVLDPAPVIYGTVTAETGGAPVEGVKVCTARQSDRQWLGCKVTNESGDYELIGLDPRDDMVVWIETLNGQPFFKEMHQDQACCDISQGTPVDVTLTDREINFQLADSASLSGIVLDSSDVQAIEGITLELLTAQCTLVASAVSDSGGHFTITGFNNPEEIYYLAAYDFNQYYIHTLYPQLNRYDACVPDVQEGRAITVGHLEHKGGTIVAMDPGGSISGAIADAEGVPLGWKGQARLYDLEGMIITAAWQNEWTSTYRIGGLMPGSYHVVFSSWNLGLIDERYDDVPCPRNSCPLHLGEPILVPGPQEPVTDKDAMLDSGAVISGRVTDIATGEGVPGGYQIYFYTSSGAYAAYANAGENGFYESVTGLPDGEYLASNQARQNYYQPVALGYLPQVWKRDDPIGYCGEPCDFLMGDTFIIDNGVVERDINLVMQHGSTISGTVTDAGVVPLANIELRLLSSLDGSVIRSVLTNELGEYIFEGVGAGFYYLRTFNTGGYEDLLWADLAEDIPCNPSCNPFLGAYVEPNGSTPYPAIDFDLETTPEIRGKVTDNLGAEMAGVRVEAYNTLGVIVAFTNTDAAGNYTIANLWDATFYVRTANNAGLVDELGLVDALYDGQFCETGETSCDPTSGTAIVLAAGVPQPDRDLQLGIAARIRGTVKHGLNAISGVTMELYRNTGDFVVSTTTDGSGAYLLDSLSGGEYHLVTRNDFGYIDEGAGGKVCQIGCPPTSTEVVSVAPNTNKEGQDFTLELGGAIAGTVFGSGDSTVVGVTIAAFNTDAAQISSTVTGPYGTYVLPGLVGDHVYLRTFNTGEYRNQLFDGLPCDGYCNVLEGTAIDAIPETLIAGKDFHLQTGFSITGMVTDTAEAGIGGILVEVFDQAKLQIGYAVSIAGGAFEIDGLPVGDYRLRTTNSAGYIDKVLGGGSCSPEPCDINDGTIIPITNADVTNVSIQLATGDTIMGTVTDINHNELPTGTAWLYSATAEFLRSAAINNGLFSFAGIADGTYYLKVSNTFGLVDQLYKDKPCPQGACNILEGTPIHVPPEEPSGILSAGSSVSPQATDPPRRNILSITLGDGYHISGSIHAMGEPVTFTKVYIFDQSGDIAGEGMTDGVGNFESDSGFPNGFYYAATSRAARPEDSAEEVADAENGVAGKGLVNQAWNGDACDGVCAPSDASGVGTSILVNNADRSDIHFVLEQAAAVELQKLTDGFNADTPNGGEAPEIAPGETVTWTYRVTNTGGVELSSIRVEDNQQVGAIQCPFGSLAPGGTMDCTASAAAEELSDGNGVSGNCSGRPSSWLYQNIGIVFATAPGGETDGVEDPDTSHYCNPRKDVIFRSSFE